MGFELGDVFKTQTCKLLAEQLFYTLTLIEKLQVPPACVN